jgi:hypothetical protein
MILPQVHLRNGETLEIKNEFMFLAVEYRMEAVSLAGARRCVPTRDRRASERRPQTTHVMQSHESLAAGNPL